MTAAVEEKDTASGFAMRGLETGRRVGWARAFDAERRADSAERDVNVLRSDVKILTAFAAQAYGALEATCGKRTSELFRGVNHEVKTFFPQGQINKGCDAMRKMLGQRADELNRLRGEIADARLERHAISDKVFTAAKKFVLRELMDRFEFDSEDALYSWLAGHRITWEGEQ